MEYIKIDIENKDVSVLNYELFDAIERQFAETNPHKNIKIAYDINNTIFGINDSLSFLRHGNLLKIKKITFAGEKSQIISFISVTQTKLSGESKKSFWYVKDSCIEPKEPIFLNGYTSIKLSELPSNTSLTILLEIEKF